MVADDELDGLVGRNAVEVVVGFCERLHDSGVAVSVASTLDFASALRAVGVQSLDLVYWAGRATLVHRPEDAATYNRVFAEIFQARPFDTEDGRDVGKNDVAERVSADDSGDDPDGASERAHYSRLEVLRQKDLATCSEEELQEAFALLRDLRIEGPPRRAHRLQATLRISPMIDIRRTLQRSIQRDGEIIDFAYRRHRERSSRVVLFLDISGSMDRYSRVLLRFAHVAVSSSRSVEAFSLGTRLTHLTRQLRSFDPNAALSAVGSSLEDLSGGTRLGEGLKQFNDGYAVRGLARGAVVVILSDGIDQGNPEILKAELERLRRIARRIIWVNPLKGTPGYAPISRGMAAALPYVDSFLEGHSLDSLSVLAAEIRRSLEESEPLRPHPARALRAS